MKHEAILALYPSVVSVSQEGKTINAIDNKGNEVSWDSSAVEAKEAELLTAYNIHQLRTERNKRLSETDYLALSDQTMTDAQKKYRQDLRDITKSATSLDDVTWPEKP